MIVTDVTVYSRVEIIDKIEFWGEKKEEENDKI